MLNKLRKYWLAVLLAAFGAILLVPGSAFAQAVADPDVVDAATDAGDSIKVTTIAVVVALIPFAIAVYLVRKALPWAKRMIK